ncbi:MAG TPA: hypothetical protein ENI79_01340 [Rhodospirillales bacterium]|nr:hypothetical protein [Rhodospirillales bacterium]
MALRRSKKKSAEHVSVLPCPKCRDARAQLLHNVELKVWACKQCGHAETDKEVNGFVKALKNRHEALSRGLLRSNGKASDKYRAVIAWYEQWMLGFGKAA